MSHMSALSGAEGIARAIALPGKTNPKRLPSFPALERTAVMAFNMPLSWNVPSSPSVGGRALLTRQACYPLWADQDFNTRKWCYGASWDCLSPGVATANYQWQVAHPPVRLVDGETDALGAYSGIADLTPKTPWLNALIGVDEGCGPGPFMYIGDPSAALFVVSLPITTGASYPTNFHYDVWVRPGEMVTREVDFTFPASKAAEGFTLSYLGITPNSWIRPRGLGISLTLTGVVLELFQANLLAATPYDSTTRIVSAATGSVYPNVANIQMYPLAYPREYYNSPLPWSATKVTAAAALFTNVTKVMNKEGTALMARLNPMVHNPWRFYESTISGLHPAEKAFLPLDTGAYTYSAPSTDLALFLDYRNQNSVGSADVPLYRLDNAAMVNAMVFGDPDGGTTLAVNVDWHIEFRTTSTLFQIGYSKVTIEALHQAQIGLAEKGYFFSNSGHESKLAKIVHFAASLSPYISLLGPIGKGVAASAHIADGMIKAMPKTPPTTTANSAGWNGPANVKAKPKPKAQAKPKPKRKGGLQMFLEAQANRRK